MRLDSKHASKRPDSSLTADNGVAGDAGGRVLLFQPRRSVLSAPRKLRLPGGLEPDGAVPDLAEFERTGEQDNYRHRMMVNAAALAFTLALAGAGVWIAESLASLRKTQDCVLMGRRNCAEVVTPTADRWTGNVTGQRP